MLGEGMQQGGDEHVARDAAQHVEMYLQGDALLRG
jgi:hypothetical protein